MIKFESPENLEWFAKKPAVTLTLTVDGDASRIQNVSIYFKDDEQTVRLQEYEDRIAAISQQEKATGGQ